MADTPTNTPPNTNNVSVTGVEDVPSLTIPLSGTDDVGIVDFTIVRSLPQHGVLKDGNGNVLTIGSVIPVVGGNLANVFFVPDANWNGVTTFQYSAHDGATPPLNDDRSPATVTITITPVNDPPDAVNDSGSTPEDTPISFTPAQLLANDTDVENDTLTVTSVQGAVHGTVTFTGGVITFTPDANYNGPASFTYTISDGHGGTDTATVNINVTPVNDPPDAKDDAGTTPEDTPITFTSATLLGNDTDPDNDTLTITSVQGAVNGAVSLAPDGKVTFTPNANYSGPASFTYTISDGHGGTDTATVNITVTPVNDPPDAVNDSGTTAEDTPISFTAAQLLANDTDPENDSLTITSVQDAVNGTVSLAADGKVTFTPNANYNGPASFTYTISDGHGGTDTATVNITVTPVNDPPDAKDDSTSTAEDTPIAIPVATLLGNDTDPDNDTLTVTSVQDAVNGTVSLVNGVVTFTPNANYNGPASFTYTISDGHGGTDTATVNINVTPVNDPPDAKDDAGTTPEDTPITFTPATLLGNDTDPENDTLTITSVQGAVNGTVSLAPDGKVTFTPNANYSGPASFTYTISDGHGGTDTATVNITVTPVNDPPDAKDDTGSTAEDTPISFTSATLLANDTDPENDSLTITSVQDAVNGTVSLAADGTVTFTPNANYNGPASFSYTISDGHGGTDTATVNINVTPVADPPETDDTTQSGNEDTLIPVALSGSDPDGSVATFVIKSLPANGTLLYGGSPVTVGQEIPASGNGASLTFKPDLNWNGETEFDYASKDNDGTVDATPGTATITVTPVNDPPETNNTSATGAEDAASIAVNLSGSDIDGTVQSFTITSLPANGVLKDGDGKVLSVGDVVPATGNAATVFFTPNANWNGDTSFNYASKDDQGASDGSPALATITVTPVNDAPDAKDDTGSTPEDTPVTFNPSTLLANDTDPDNDSLTITSVQDAVNGTVTFVGGVITFTPDANYNGPASFTYTISDGHGGTDTATVNINVTPVNDGPETNNTSAAGNEDQPKIEVHLSGSDPDGTVATFTIKDLPANGTLTDANGNVLSVGSTVPATGGEASVFFTPNANWNGDTSFHYASNDNEGLQDPTPATANINVAPLNDPPETDNVNASGNEDSAGIPVALHGSDVDGTVATFTINSLPANGTLLYNGAPVTVGQVIPATGNGAGVTFVPNANWNGVTDFNYTATDNQGAQDPTPGVATITVASVNDGPDTGNSSAQGIKGALNIGLTMTGTDPDGTVVSFTIKSLPSNGVLTDGQGKTYAVGDVVTATNGQADIFFTPTATFTGTVTFNYASNDNGGAQDATPGVGTVVITPPITAPDPKPPETNNTSASGNEDVVKLPISLTGTDTDGTVKSFVINDLPANGKLYDANGVQLSVGSVVTATGNAATVYFTPNANWNGDTSFHYAAKDNDGLVDATPATAKIHINAVNDGPDTCDVTVCASSCADYVKVGLAGSDTDGKVVSFVITSLPTDGVLKYGSTVLKVGDIVPANSYGQASVTFYPNSNWDGVSTFKYASKDDGGAVDATPATATIKVSHANYGPETQSVSVTGTEDGGPVTIKITGTDADGTVTAFKIDSLPANGVLKFGTQVLKAGDVITATSNSATLTFTPNANWNGVTSFNYQARDNDGAYDSTPATGKITINGDNDGPETKDVTASGCEDGGKIAVCLAGTDPDGKVVSFTITDLPANGVLTDSTGKVLTAGSVVTATSNGATVYFTPNANWNGSTSFHYAAKDDAGAADATPATAKITVTDVNDAPTTNSVSATGVEDQTTAIKLTLSGADVDGTVTAFKITSLPLNGVLKDGLGNTLSVGSLVTATGGTAAVYFTPKANFFGETTFQYAAKDNAGLVDGSPATGKITITGVNDGPVAVNDTATVTSGSTVKLTSLLSNDTDADGDNLTITSVQAANHGSVVLNTDGSVSFTGQSGYTGAGSFTYTISDGHGGTSTATVSVDIKAPSAPAPTPTGIGVHTQGFWANNGAVYWDGEVDPAGTKHSPTYATFPKAELTYKVDTNADGVVDSQKYLLIGDFNKNGVTDAGEHTFLISLSDAKGLLTCATADARVILGRDLVTAWLNYLSENPMGSPTTANTPAWFVEEAVDWLSQVSGTNKTLANGGVVNSGATSGGDFVGTDILTSSSQWQTGINLDGVSGINAAGKDVDAGSHLHDVLDAFNNTGKIGSTIWANDGD